MAFALEGTFGGNELTWRPPLERPTRRRHQTGGGGGPCEERGTTCWVDQWRSRVSRHYGPNCTDRPGFGLPEGRDDWPRSRTTGPCPPPPTVRPRPGN